MKKLHRDKVHQIHLLAQRHLPQASIAAALGCSVGTVNKYLSTPAPAVKSRAPKEAKASELSSPTRRDELVAAWNAVDPEDLDAYHAASLALARHDDPLLDARLAEGQTIPETLFSLGDRLHLLTTPAHFAELAMDASSEEETDRAPGESEEDYARYLTAIPLRNRQRAVSLLESALAIVRADASPNEKAAR